MTDYEIVRSMVLNFRLTELQNLMAFVGQGKHGRKSDLQVMVHFRSKIWLTVFVFLNFGPT